jgi:hypothetical protein
MSSTGRTARTLADLFDRRSQLIAEDPRTLRALGFVAEDIPR